MLKPITTTTKTTITCTVTNSMKEWPCSEANQFSAGQEISRILWNPKIHCSVYKSPPPVPVLSQLVNDYAFASDTFLDAFAKLRKATFSFAIRLSVRPFACNNSAATRKDFH
jgi:hypothetical protein